MITLRAQPAEGIVLKRANSGEADRIVTLLTKEFGKIAGVAKGVRKLSSTKKSYLEPGNHIKVLFVKTHSLPIITQATLLDQALQSNESLQAIRSLVQWLEIMDKVFVEEELQEELYSLVLASRHECLSPVVNRARLRQQLSLVLEHLGFTEQSNDADYSISNFVNTIADRPLRGFEYLKV
jgi:DNA repair protein RecO